HNFFLSRIKNTQNHLYHPHLGLPASFRLQPNTVENSVALGIVLARAALVERGHDRAELFRELVIAPSVPSVVLPAPALPALEDFADRDFELRTEIAALVDEHFDVGGQIAEPF